jgi:uncharacterized repeat protein (TIGR03803 family)
MNEGLKKKAPAHVIRCIFLEFRESQDKEAGFQYFQGRTLMANLKQLRKLTTGPGVGATTAALALAIVFVLTIVTTGTAHAQSYQVIYSFMGFTDGAKPYAGLTIDAGGNLYGTTYAGHEGVNWGGVYELKRGMTGWTFYTLTVFDGTLSSGVVFGPDHALYGTSPNNIAGYYYGYVYRVRPPISVSCHVTFCPWTGTTIYHFTGGADGSDPTFGSLLVDHAGNMYDTTAAGGSGNGVVYELMRAGSGWTELPLYAFSGSPDGAVPYAGLIFDNAGNLYGTTTAGGTSGRGTVFELSPNGGGGWTEQVLYSFTGGSDGSFPTGGLTFDPAGNLYGSTNKGGSGGGGTVFKLTPSGGGWSYSLVKSFTGSSGCGPFANLAFDGAGNLYGTTLCDGANNAGNVFKLTPSGGGWTYSSLHDFTGGSDGGRPRSNVTFDTAGNLFGTASGGGNGVGVVWEITP